jgi:hypothetical protein
MAVVLAAAVLVGQAQRLPLVAANLTEKEN